MGCVCGVGLKVGMRVWVRFTYDNIFLPAHAQVHPYNAYHLKFECYISLFERNREGEKEFCSRTKYSVDKWKKNQLNYYTMRKKVFFLDQNT